MWAFWVNTHSDNSSQQSSTQTLAGTSLSNFTPVAKVDKLQIIDTQVGSGAAVKTNSTVTVAYTGAVAATGTIFQSSSDVNGGQPIQFELSKVIKGWQDGMIGMKVGGQRRISFQQLTHMVPIRHPGLVFQLTRHWFLISPFWPSNKGFSNHIVRHLRVARYAGF